MDVRRAWVEALEANLRARRDAHLLRELRPVDSASGPVISVEGRSYVQFCGNNYLGLATDPEVITAAREATERWGTGAGASRLVAGSLVLHHELEAALARFKRTEAALVLPTGFMANLAVLTTLVGEGDVVVSDKLNHASLLDAAKFSGAVHRTFPHRQYVCAAALFGKTRRREDAKERREDGEEESGGKRKFLVTDSVFSMDGDLADLRAVCDVAEVNGVLVVIDEAHGTGVMGKRGAGVAELQGVEKRIAITVGTLSKALGSLGGFVAGPRAVIDTLVNHARSFIYTTALPAGCVAAALAALRIVERDATRRQRVLALAERVRGELRGMGYDCGDSASPIIPVMIADSEKALLAAEFLKERGIYVPAIRPPTVPPNSARLRISLMATHTDSQAEQLVSALRALRDFWASGGAGAGGG